MQKALASFRLKLPVLCALALVSFALTLGVFERGDLHGAGL